MPIHDPKLPLRLELCRDDARQPQLVGNAVESVCKEHIIDRLRHDRIELHRVGHYKLAVSHARLSKTYPCLIQHGRVDVDGEDVICYSGQRSREQSVAATEVNYDYSALHAHFGFYGETRFRMEERRVTLSPFWSRLRLTRFLNRHLEFYETYVCYLIRGADVQVKLRVVK